MMLMDSIGKKLKDLLKKDLLDKASNRYNRHFIRTKPDRIKDVTQLLIDDFDGRLVAISANDEGLHGFDLVYHFDLSHQEKNLHLAVKVRLPREKPVIKSITDVAWSANWAERELMDLMGIQFEGHPDPRRLFLPYAWPSEEVG